MLFDGAGRPMLTFEVAHVRVGPDGSLCDAPASGPRIELVRLAADPNPFPLLRLWSRRRG